MAISGDYPTPVFVNGYACNNCAQVAEAKQGVDPADPKAGPYGVDAKATSAVGQSPAVIFGGVLAQGAGGVAAGQAVSDQPSVGQPLNPTAFANRGVGGLIDLSV